MTLHDYNGIGPWSAAGITSRYREYAKLFCVASEANLVPVTTAQGDTRWVYPVMDKVIDGIEAGDPACAELGIDFISESGSFSFGMRLKSNTARALRRATLNDQQRERIRTRVVQMLVEGYVPKEYREYAKLLRKIGIGPHRAELQRANTRNPSVAKYIKYLEAACKSEDAV